MSMHKTKRIPFTDIENRIIRESVRKMGEKWDAISEKLPGRTPKQIHDRYINYLRDGLKAEPWSKEEDDILMKMYKLIGPKWSKMMINLPGRSGNDIKNRWHKHLIKLSGDFDDKKAYQEYDFDFDDDTRDQSNSYANSYNFFNDLSLQNNTFQDSIKNSHIEAFPKVNVCDSNVHSFNEKEMLSKKKTQAGLQNSDFDKSFGKISNYHPVPINQNVQNSACSQPCPVKLINKIDIGENSQNLNDILFANKIPDFNPAIFQLDVDDHEFYEELGFHKFDYLWFN